MEDKQIMRESTEKGLGYQQTVCKTPSIQNHLVSKIDERSERFKVKI